MAATPVSTTATTTPAPRVTAHAAATPMASSPHCCARPGSGVARSSACRRRTGSAKRTARERRSARKAAARWAGRHVHDDHAQARDGADLDGVCRLERRRGDGARPQADGDGVACARRPGSEQEDQGDEGGYEAAGVRRRHAGSLAAGRVTAQARGVPDV